MSGHGQVTHASGHLAASRAQSYACTTNHCSNNPSRLSHTSTAPPAHGQTAGWRHISVRVYMYKGRRRLDQMSLICTNLPLIPGDFPSGCPLLSSLCPALGFLAYYRRVKHEKKKRKKKNSSAYFAAPKPHPTNYRSQVCVKIKK